MTVTDGFVNTVARIGQTMHRRTLVVSSSLAYRGRRLVAAQASEFGLDIVTLPRLAARLAGGFLAPADPTTLVNLVSRALADLQFAELEPVRDRPGTARAVVASLHRVWAARISLDASDHHPRLRDLGQIENYVRERLPAAFLLPNDLADRAIRKVDKARAILGSVEFDRLVDIDPLWRPLITALSEIVDVSWAAAGLRDRTWFPGNVSVAAMEPKDGLECEVCADPRAEVVEALRWARALLSDGRTRASDIAIASADTSVWDDHMVVLAADGDIPVHFASGRPALSTRAGQVCAALADIMLNGLAQDRLRRLALLSPYLSDALPTDWTRGIPDEAGLFEPRNWQLALGGKSGADGTAIAPILMPVIEELALGPGSAEALGAQLLRGASLGMWQEALRLAPAPAIAMTLGTMRVADERDPSGAVVWCNAADLVGAPRRHMRLIGLSSRTWPRAEVEDPLLPAHLVERKVLFPFTRLERDRIAFQILTTNPGSAVSVSRSRRSAEGTFLAKSALLQTGVTERLLSRTRVPGHAFSEADRLLARPEEATELPRIRHAVSCWTHWSRGTDATPHDGLVRANHPAIVRALARPQSATSLRRLLRDPLGFVFRYALGMNSPEIALQPLQLDAKRFGALVHELLRLAVDALEPSPGLVNATTDQVDEALTKAAAEIENAWPLQQAVPPRLLWLDTVREARRRAYRGLTLDERFGPGTRSWSEIEFGNDEVQSDTLEPWSRGREVVLGQPGLRIRGRVDRVDVKPDRRAVRVTDYKTGNTPRGQHGVTVGGGAEVQRALYSIAIKQLIPEVQQVVSRLAYLDSEDRPFELKGEALEAAEEKIIRFATVAVEQVIAGLALPGPDAFGEFNDLRLALPANLDSYRNRKSEGFGVLHCRLAALWSEP